MFMEPQKKEEEEEHLLTGSDSMEKIVVSTRICLLLRLIYRAKNYERNLKLLKDRVSSNFKFLS